MISANVEYNSEIRRSFYNEPLFREGYSVRIEGIEVRAQRATQIAVYSHCERRTRIVFFAADVPAVEYALARAIGGYSGPAGRIEKKRFQLALSTSSSLAGPVVYFKRVADEERRLRSTALDGTGIRALQEAFAWMTEGS